MYDLFKCFQHFLLEIGMLCIYLTLNHQIIAPQYITVAPQYITVAPHPAAIATLYGTAFFQYEAALSDLGTYKCGLILLASVQLSIKLILSLSLVS